MSLGEPNILSTVICFTLAEFIWRFVRAILECIKYPKHYSGAYKYNTIFAYSFTFSKPAIVLLIIIAIAVATQYENLSNILVQVWKQKILIIIIFLFRLTTFDKSTLFYSDMIRSNSGLDYATGMASNYFHGYLKFTLPSVDETKGIRERILNYEDKHSGDYRIQFAVQRLFILIPDSLHSKPILQSEIMQREENAPLESVQKDRAGVSRPYRNDVYRIVIDGKPYYIAVEGATPLLSFSESISHDLTSTWQMKAMQREITLKFYTALKDILSKYHETMQQVELVYYNDISPENRLYDVGHVLAAHIKRVWAEEEALKKHQ